jgi:hypothetical protein
MPGAGGRPKGSKNGSRHRAGGRREGAGHPRKQIEGQQRLQFFQSQASASIEDRKEASDDVDKNAQLKKTAGQDEQQAGAENPCTAEENQCQDLNLPQEENRHRDENQPREENECREDRQTRDREQALEMLHRIARGEQEEQENPRGNGDAGDESDDDGHDYDTDDEGEGEVNSQCQRKRTGYVPPKGSTLDTYLKLKQDAVRNGRIDLSRGQAWIPPSEDPLSRSCSGEPDHWYTSECWVYLWLPLDQFKTLITTDMLKCI